MAARSLSFGWCLALGTLVLGLAAGCGGGSEPPDPPPPPDKQLPDAALSTVEVSRTSNVLANGSDALTVTVTVRKADGATLADRTVQLEVSGEGNTLTPASGKTDAQGVFTATLTSTVPGSKRVTATVEADGAPVVLGSRPTVEFIALQPDRLAFSSATFQATAGAPLSPLVEVHIQDAEGATVRGSTLAVTLELASGPAAGQLEGTLTVNAVDGVARFPEAVIKKAGSGYSLRALADALTAATSATFDVVPAAAATLELVGLPASMTAGDTADVQVTLKDAFDNLATGYSGTLHFSATDGSAVLPADFTFSAADAGQRSFSGLSLRRAGAQRITVTDTASATLTASVDVQVGAAAPARLAFTQQPGNRSVRVPLGLIEVTLTDAFDNLTAVGAPSVALALNPSSAPLSGTTSVAPVDGVASFNTLTISEEGTGYTFTASATGLASATSVAFDIVDDVAPAQPVLIQGATTATSIVVQWTSVGDDTTQGTAASQELRYATSNIVTDADFAAATLVTTAAPLPAGSNESAMLSDLTPGANYYVALKVTDNAGNSVRSATLPVSTSDPVVTQLAFVTQPVNGTAGSALADVRVALQDTNGDTVPTASSAVTLNLRNGPVFTPVTVNAVAGVATFSGLRVDTAGSGYRFEASSGALTPVQSDAFSIAPAAAASLELVGLVAPVTAGVANSVQVTAYDAFSNVATGYTGTVHFTSTDPSAGLPADATFTPGDAGQKTIPGVVLNTVGTQTVTVTDTLNAALTDSLTVDVGSGAATQLVLSVPATPVTAGSGFSVQVTLRDGSGNIATGYAGTVHFTSTDGNALLPLDYTFTAGDAGQKTFTNVQLRTAGAQSLTVVDTVDGALTQTQGLTVTPADAATLVLTAPSSANAGVAFSVTVTARDAFNNVAAGYTGTVQFTSDDGQATLPPDYTFTGGDAGSRMFNVTLGTAGDQPVRVADGTHNASATVTVAAGSATRLELTGLDSPLTAGVPDTVAVTAYDAFDNVATGYTGTVVFTSTDPAAQLPGDYTFSAGDAGTATMAVELRTVGTWSVTVTDSLNGLLTSSASTSVEPGAPGQLIFSVQPTHGTVHTLLAEIRVVLLDDHGNPTTASSPTVTVGLSGGNPAASLIGTLNRDPVSGEASFTDLFLDQEGTGFQLTAIASGLVGATSAPFNIVDDIAPATPVITSMPASSSSVTVTWTAVGDDDVVGTADSYDLRYATFPINSEADFEAATSYPIPPPQPSGSLESATVTGLSLTQDLYFALKVYDGGGNFSRSASVVVSGDVCTGVTCTPPPSTCSADGTTAITYTSMCVDSGGVGVCQDDSTSTRCQSYETCESGACVPVTPGSQAGQVIISEFSALGAELIELHNPTASPIDVYGYTFRNAAGEMADIRAASDQDGSSGTPVLVPPGGYLRGAPNPAGPPPPGVDFLYGAPGTPFALVDTGDALALYTAAPAGNLQDAVDFRSFITHPDTPLPPTAFVGFAGSTTQVDPTSLTAAGNDSATGWCVSFYPAGMRGARILDTLGAPNGSCKVAVINEAYGDAPGGDDQQAFVEIAGPGGAFMGGAKLTDVEGRGGSAGTLNSAMGEYTFPAGARIPADGILLVVDTNLAGNTQVPNFVPGVDLTSSRLDPENNGGDALQLVSAEGILLDALGYDANGANLDTNVAYNGLAMYEGGTALYPSSPTSSTAASLARAPTSEDTDNNRADFHADPSPTPGLPNDAVNFTATSLSPDDMPAAASMPIQVTVSGTDFSPGLRMQIGEGPANTPCTALSSTQATCSVTSSPGGVEGLLSLTFINPPNVGVANAVMTDAFTYTGTENETDAPTEADFCNLQFPGNFSVMSGQMTLDLYGRIYEAGLTEAPGAPAGVLAEVGYGALGSDPRLSHTWSFFPADYNVQAGSDDEYVGVFMAPTVAVSTDFAFTYRFSQDGGMRWTYCDLNGAGSNSGLDFEPTQLGVMTVTP